MDETTTAAQDALESALADTDLVSVFAGAFQHAASWADLAQTVQMSPAEIAAVLWRINERATKYVYTDEFNEDDEEALIERTELSEINANLGLT